MSKYQYLSCALLTPILFGLHTRLSKGDNKSTVWISQGDCLSTTEAGQESMVKSVDAEIELLDDDGRSALLLSVLC